MYCTIKTVKMIQKSTIYLVYHKIHHTDVLKKDYFLPKKNKIQSLHMKWYWLCLYEGGIKMFPLLLKLPTSYNTQIRFLPHIFLTFTFIFAHHISHSPVSGRWTHHLPWVLWEINLPQIEFTMLRCGSEFRPHSGECSKAPTFVLFSISWMVSCIGMLKLCRMLPPKTSVSSGV